MSLTQRLSDLEHQDRRRCPTGRLIDGLPDEDRASLEAALVDTRISTLKIHSALQAEGYRLSRTTLHDHRARRCYCSEDAA